jgi:heat shock protein HtpX
MVQSFYQQQSANRRNSVLLILLVGMLLGVLGFVIGYLVSGYLEGAVILTGGALAFATVLSAGSYFAGDSLVLAASQARPVQPADHPQLMNVVQELSIAANVPVPAVYLIDDSAPNAFATGRDPKHASVAVTTGLLDKLDREELQGVIGHELSHVRNLDIRFALLVAVLVGSIALISDLFLRGFLRVGIFGGGGGRGGRDRGGGGVLGIVLVLVAIVLAIVAPIFARMVQLAVSRQREYLADASSVELTRNPAGLERALVKVASDRDVLEAANRATQHLYFVNPIKKFEARASGLFSTHPPILDRINRLRSLRGAPAVGGTDAIALEAME